MANIDMRTREGRAMRAAAEAAKQSAAAGKVLNEVQPQSQDHSGISMSRIISPARILPTNQPTPAITYHLMEILSSSEWRI